MKQCSVDKGAEALSLQPIQPVVKRLMSGKVNARSTELARVQFGRQPIDFNAFRLLTAGWTIARGVCLKSHLFGCQVGHAFLPANNACPQLSFSTA